MDDEVDKTSRELIEKWVPDKIREMTAYGVPDASGYIKLDAMENPYPLPASLRSELSSLLAAADINRYPDASCVMLKARLKEVLDIPANVELVMGNGSDELIMLLAVLLGGPGRTLLAPSPSFSMYRQIAGFIGSDFETVPLLPDFGLDFGALMDRIRCTSPACIFLAYPNNPTGNYFDDEQIRELIRIAPGLVVLDEAYFPFGGKSFVGEVGSYPNLAVLRTLSKSGFAGLRLGFLVANSEWAAECEKIRLPYNINVLSQVAASACLDQYGAIQDQIDTIVASRESLFAALQKLDNLDVYPSSTNFLLARVAHANDVHQGLRDAGILVKNLHGSEPALENCLRITVGTDDENHALIAALQSVL